MARRAFDSDDRAAIRQAIREWLRIRDRDERPERFVIINGQRHIRLSQLDPDVDHSALLDRLLSGKEPLPEPPPTEHSYPVYPPDEPENVGSPHEET